VWGWRGVSLEKETSNLTGLFCFSSGKIEQHRGRCKPQQNIIFIVMIITQLWLMITQLGNNEIGKKKKKTATERSKDKEWATYSLTDFSRNLILQIC
jgi:hypothetical protein